MKTPLLTFFATLLATLSFGQIDSLYLNLDTTQLTTTIFWDEQIDAQLPSGILNPVPISAQRTKQIVQNLKRFEIQSNTSIIPDLVNLRSTTNASKQLNGIIPIAVFDLRYNIIDTNAVLNGSLFGLGNQLLQSANANVFGESQLLITHFDIATFGTDLYKFILQPEHFIHNYTDSPELIRIDFGDGLGFRNITYNEVISVQFPSNAAEVVILTEVIRGDDIHQGAMHLKTNLCISDYSTPDFTSPFPNNGTPEFPWLLSTTFEGTNICGNAYPLVSGVFDKPLIFVEGIDFNRERNAERNGDFGWCQLTSGLDYPGYDYYMLAKMPFFLDAVRAHGYDIILLDFCDGATYMEHNGQLLVHLISLINEYKVGDEPNVLAGASMGGQVSRYALDFMEQNNQPHCARLYISLDSPHEGANIPTSIQQAITLMAGENAGAQEFITDYLQRPATKQLLMAQYSTNAPPNSWYHPVEHAAWYNLMHQWGLPQLCRNFAITNGNVEGLGLAHDHPGFYSSVDPIVSYSCERLATSPGPEARIFISNANGDPYYNQDGVSSSNGMNVSVHITKTDMKASVGGWQILLNGVSGFLNPVKVHFVAKLPESATMWDYAPGGYRKTATDFIQSINSTGDLTGGGCNNIGDYLKKHCFIPTTSALAIVTNSANFSFTSSMSPFDQFYGPLENNEPHILISDANLEVLLNEVLNCENPDGSPLVGEQISSATGSFNYGKVGFHHLRSCHVTDAAQLGINAEAQLHWGNENYPLTGSSFKLTTLAHCAASQIVVDNEGVLQMGSGNLNTTAELKLLPESSLTIGTGGHLKMAPGSTIIVEKDAQLIFYTESDIDINDATIVVKTGGQLIIRQSPGFDNIALIKLIKENASIVFDGGRMVIEDGVTFQTDASSTTGGFVEFKGNRRVNLLLGQNAKFHLIGADKDDLILRVADQNMLRTNHSDLGTIQLDKGLIDLSHNGAIWTKHKLIASNLKIEDPYITATNALATIYVTHQDVCNLYNCDFNKVVLDTWHTQSWIHTCTFTDCETALRIAEGSFQIHNSIFDRANLKSNSLAHLSTINNTEFRNIDVLNPIEDESLVEIRMTKSTIIDCQRGIFKHGGKLSIKCSEFRNISTTAIEVYEGDINCSSASAAGYNIFQNVGTCMYLNKVFDFDLYKGFNDFSGYTDKCFEGTLIGRHLCNNCETWQDASYNHWGSYSPYFNGISSVSGLMYPETNENAISLYYSNNANQTCNILTPNGYSNGCKLRLFDTAPNQPSNCGGGKPVLRKLKNMIAQKQPTSPNHSMQLRDEVIDTSNPLLETPHFNNVTLDSALVYAASQMTVYDSLGNDGFAAELFHEILTSGLDRAHPEIRWRMRWGQSQMKGCIENMFVHGQLQIANNQESFENHVQYYVNVLNLMTDTLLTDSTYKEQFYLELDKGQLLRTIGQTVFARDAYMQLDNCQLDAPEQAALNNWLYEVDQELSLSQQYLEDELAPTDVTFDVDTTAYEVPMPNNSSNYYFGMWIHSPTDMTFMTCGNDPEFRNFIRQSTNSNWTLYPNPTAKQIWLSGPFDEQTIVRVFDMEGRLLNELKNIGSTSTLALSVVAQLSPGIYQVHIIQGNLDETIRLIKQ